MSLVRSGPNARYHSRHGLRQAGKETSNETGEPRGHASGFGAPRNLSFDASLKGNQ
jgi:hypothetical protein